MSEDAPKKYRKHATDMKRVGPTTDVRLVLPRDVYAKIRYFAGIQHESVPHMFIRLAENARLNKQMVVLNLPVGVVNDAYYLARHYGFENHEKWFEQSLCDSVREAAKQLRESGIILRRLLIDGGKPLKNLEEEEDEGSAEEGS